MAEAIRLWHDSTSNGLPRGATQGGPDANALVALYLPSSGTIPPAPARSLILRHSDYKSGQKLLHIAGTARIALQTADALEIGRGWVWTPFTVPARAADGDISSDDVYQGLTSGIK